MDDAMDSATDDGMDNDTDDDTVDRTSEAGDPSREDTFTLWDLRVETRAVPGREMVCNHPEGSYFEARGEQLHFPDGQPFPMYPLAALLPLLPAKQRPTDDADWMTTDTDVACPDPHCGAVFRITRIARRTFRHGDVTVVPMPSASNPKS